MLNSLQIVQYVVALETVYATYLLDFSLMNHERAYIKICFPLYNFSFIYNYLMASPRSFVDSFLDKKDGRYNPKMSPYIPMSKWRKGSQWITLIRKHAEVVADDDAVFPVFKIFCKRRPPLEASKGKKNMKLQKQHNCIPDEHYVQTLLAMYDFDGELERRTITYTEWNESVTNMEKKGWHPITFSYADAGPVQIKRIKDIRNVYYASEYRTEWCRSNSTLVTCFLFARKFSRGAAMRLLNEGAVSRNFKSSTTAFQMNTMCRCCWRCMVLKGNLNAE
ncbi:hypothetical protein K7X08_033474 [Anisodus acutangulus]|uniref:Uncharacterized protein n=1 Tax=Anisodus acutangulus TaxID=402998 RepID=A0A9Q1RD92_9SOLA|nr:hypothetical protein K7X08_033474 [Anisodus acutangulus]